MKSKFLNISIGVTLMLLGTGFLLRSIPVAHATPTPENFVEEGTNKIGTYMFQIYGNPADQARRYAIVWNTQTGKSLGYYTVGDQWVSEKLFPANPLGE